jgi:phosphoglycerol transferase MdoB-like AlkP superfamily enzyme
MSVEVETPPMSPLQQTGTDKSHWTTSMSRVVALAVSLILCMLPARTLVIMNFDREKNPGLTLPEALAHWPEAVPALRYDMAYVVAITLPALALLWMVRQSRRLQSIVVMLFAIAAIVSLVASLANVQLVPKIGRPFTYQWLYYSDFLRSRDAKQAMTSDLSATLVLGYAWMIAMLLLLAWGFARLWKLAVPRWVTRREVLFAIIPLLVIYMPFSRRYCKTWFTGRNKLQNPVIAFVASAVKSHRSPSLFTANTPIGPEDFLPIAQRPKSSTTAPDAAAAGIKNVVLFVFESVPAKLTDPYGSAYAVTPNLAKATAERGLLVSDVYAHAPSTNQSMLSLLCSVYPWISYQSLTQEHPEIPLPSLSGVLHDHDFRTGFFYGADLTYQRSNEFLQHRSFDRLEDYRVRVNCSKQTNESKAWPFLNNSDDVCTVESLVDWIERGDQSHPFFGVVWTGMTHFPYFVAGEEQDLTGGNVQDKYLKRYLNSLKRGDEALGELLRALDEKHLSDSTLVVVVADHGEAFAEHGTYSHASAIYEENIRVPCVLIQPKLFGNSAKHKRLDVIGGIVDVAPTILDLLRIDPPGQWQGRSFFDSNRSGRVYFFEPWNDFKCGLSEKNRKMVFNATESTVEAYDLSSDPNERADLSGDASWRQFVTTSRQRLAAWVQFEGKMYADLTGRK